MRPAGEIRLALRACIPAEGQGGALTWRDAAQQLAAQGLINVAAPGEVRLVRRTMENMRLAGELQRSASVRVLGSRRPMAAYARSPQAGGWVMNWGGVASGPGASLAAAVHAWQR